MHSKKASLIVLFITLAMSMFAAASLANPANAVTSNANPPKITSTGDSSVYQSSYQNPGFYAQGRYWVFYEDSSFTCEHQTGCLFFTSSQDGSSWATAPTNVGIHVTDNDWSVVTDGAGAFAYYVRYNETSFDSNSNQTLLFGKGQLNSPGVGQISWQPEQRVLNQSPTARFPNDVIGVDSLGQVWIGYELNNVTLVNRSPHIIHSNSTLPPQPLSSSFVVNASDPIVTQTVGFDATAVGGSSSFAFGWSFGDGSSAMGQHAAHNYALPGAYTVTLRVNDTSSPKQSSTSTQTIPVGLLFPSSNKPPSLIVPTSQSVKTGAAVSFTVTAVDGDPEPVTVTNPGGLPRGAEFTNSTRHFAWIPTIDQAGKLWTITFNATDTGSPQLSVTRQVLIYVSPSWTGDVNLQSASSASPNGNWHVDIATLLSGGVYAAYWATGSSLFGRLNPGSGSALEEPISGSPTSTDVNSFVFASGMNVSAIWFDTLTGKLFWGFRGPLGGWGQNVISPGEAASATALGRYSLPFTAAVNQAALPNPEFYIFWYNSANRVIDEFSGYNTTWIKTNSTFSTQASLGSSNPTIGSFHYSAPVSGKSNFGIMWVDGSAPSFNLNFGLESVGAVPTPSSDSSWNPRVGCTPLNITIEQILGNQPNSFGGATEGGSIFNPGIRAPSPGDAKRWLTPPCVIRNGDGQVVSAFVEIYGVQRGFLVNEDYSAVFDPVNGGGPHPGGANTSDTTFKIFSAGYGGCASTSTNSSCYMHSIHLEFDHDWKAAGYCGPNTVCDPYQLAQQAAVDGAQIDVQGFVYWDPEHLADASHSFSGWEIHPLTAWRLHGTSSTFKLSTSQSKLTILPGQSGSSNINITGSNVWQSFSINMTTTISRPGPTATMKPVTVTVPPCNQCSLAFSTLNVTTTAGNAGNYTVTVSGSTKAFVVTGGIGISTKQVNVTALVQGFTISANPSSLSLQAGSTGTSIITLTSLSSFSGTVNLSQGTNGCACFTSSLNSSSVLLPSGGTKHVLLTVTATSITGNENITVTGNAPSIAISESTLVKVTSVDFTINSARLVLGVDAGSSNSTTITLGSVNGFSGSVSLSVSSNSTSLTARLNLSSVNLQSSGPGSTATLLLTVNGTKLGNYLVIVTAVNGSLTHNIAITVHIVDFSLKSQSSIQNYVGSSGSVPISLSSLNGFANTIALTNSTNPAGISWSLAPKTISLTSGGTGSATLSFLASLVGNYTVTITGTSGPLMHSIFVKINVVDFQVSSTAVTPSSVDATTLGNSTITATGLNGFTGTVVLTVSPSTPSGLSCLFSSSSLSLPPSIISSILSCSIPTAGNYTVSVTAKSGSLTHSITSISFHVVDFTISPKPPLTMIVGAGQQSTVNFASVNGFSGTIILNAIVTPTGPSASFSPPAVTLTSGGFDSSILSIQAGSVTGVYVLNVTGTNGKLTRTLTISLTVQDYSIGTAPTSVTVLAGTAGTSTVTTTGANGFTGTVNLSIGVSPSTGLSCGLTKTSVIVNSTVTRANSTLSCSGLAGTYAVTITGSSAGIVHAATANFVVQDFTTIANPTSVTVFRNTTANSTITVNGLDGFNGTITLTTIVSPSAGLSCVFNPATLVINQTDTQRLSTLACTDTLSSGTFTVSVTASSRGLSRSASVTYTVGTAFTITSNPTSVTIPASSAGHTTIVVKYAPTFSGTVTLTSTISPATGLSCALSVATITSSGNSTLTCSGSAGLYNVSVNGTSPGNSASTTVTYTVQDFTLSATPSAVTANVGAASPSTITVTPLDGFSGTVTLVATTNSTNLACNLSVTSLSGGSGTSILSCSAAMAGNYLATVTGTSTSLVHAATVTYHIQDFSVKSSTSTLTTNAGTSANSTITLGSLNGIQGNLSLATLVSPSGPTAAYLYNGIAVSSLRLLPNGVNSTLLKITVPSSTPGGSYTVNATFTISTITHFILIPVTVIGQTTTAVSCTPSQSAISQATTCTITIGSFGSNNSPAGTISFTSNSTGTFSPPSATCGLTTVQGVTSCQIGYTPNISGHHLLNATYPGDTFHLRSSGIAILAVGLRATSASLVCNPSSLSGAGGQTTCTATVTDNSPPSQSTPTGSVNFVSNSTGIFDSGTPSCGLSPTATSGIASCQITYTASVVGAHLINATYTGDIVHVGSKGSTTVTVGKDPTTISIGCSSGTVDGGQALSCTATVTDTSLVPTTPSGAVTFTTNSTGTFTPLATCGLTKVSSAVATCSLTYTPTVSGHHQLQGSYGGDATHAAALGTSSVIKVNPVLTVGTPTATPLAIDTGQTTTLQTSFTGGTPSYSCQWLERAPGASSYSSLGAASPCTSPLTFHTGTLTTVGTLSFELNVTDSSGSPATITSSPAIVTVNAALSTATISVSPGAIDTGQSSALATTTSFSGGTNPYSCQWLEKTPSTTTYSNLGNSFTCALGSKPNLSTGVLSIPGNWSFELQTRDSGSPTENVTSTGVIVTVNSALSAPVVSANPTTIDPGQTATLTTTSSFNSGTSPFTCQWKEKAPGATSYVSLGNTFSCKAGDLPTTTSGPLSITGVWSFTLQVNDTGNPIESVSSNSVPVTVNGPLSAGAITPPSPTIDSGQSIVLAANPAGGNTPYTYQWFSDGSCTTVIGSATSSSYTASPTVTSVYTYKVTDASTTSQCSPSNSVSVNAALAAGAVTPSSPTIDAGQSITIAAHASGGTIPYGYLWYSDATCTAQITSATGSTYIASPTATTTYSYKVTDSANSPVSKCSTQNTITVSSMLQSGSISPSSATIDNGQSVTLTANPSGGTTPYSYQWYSGTSPTCASDTTILGTTSTQTVTPSSSTYYCYKVVDSSTGTPPASATSTTTLIAVNAPVSAGAITPPSPTVDNGQSITLTANPSGGSTPYSYQWYAAAGCPSGNLITGATSLSYAASPTTTTTYTYKVSDSSQGTPASSACSPSDTVTVGSGLIAGAISPSSPNIDSGETITLTASASGGTTPYSYQWYTGTSPTCSSDATQLGTSSTQTVSPTTTSYYCYKVTDSSSNPATATSATDLVTVNRALNTPSATATSPIDAGQSTTITVSWSGGTASYNVTLYTSTSSSSCTGLVQLMQNTGISTTSTTFTQSPSATVSYCANVNDSANLPSASQTGAPTTVTVLPALAINSESSNPLYIDSGQSSSLSATFSGGTPTYICQWLQKGPGATSYSPLGSSAACSSPVSASTGALSVSGSWSFELQVTDSAALPLTKTSSAVTVTVNLAASAPAVSATPSAIDSGQSAALSTIASFSGGTSPFTCQWLVKPPVATSFSNLGSTFSCAAGDKPSTSTGVLTAAGGWSFELQVSDSGTPTEIVASPATTVTVNQPLAAPVISVNPTAINSGQSGTLSTTASFTGGTATYSCQWLEKAPGGSAYGKLGISFSCNPGDTPTTSTGPLSSTGSWSFELQVTDSGSPLVVVISNVATVTVNGNLSAGSITPTSPTIDTGQSITLTANPSGGTSPYSYQWYLDGVCTTAISSATGPTYVASPAATSTYSVKVTDSATSSQCSTSVTVTVNSGPFAGAITPSAPTFDAGQAITLTSHASGGTAPLSYQWYSDGACSATIGGANGATFTTSPTATATYSYKATDSAQGAPPISTCSVGDTVTVNPALVAGAITPAGPVNDVGQSVALTSHASGGTLPLSYQWYQDGSCTTPVSGATSSTFTASPTTTTTYSYKVTDSSNSPASQCSIGDVVTVNSALVAGSISPSNPSIDSGQSIVLTANPTSGTSPYSYQWFSGSTTTCSSDTAILGTAKTQSVSPTTNTYYCYSVTDSASSSQSSATDLVSVNSALIAGTVTPGSPSIDSGQSITLTANPTGGTTPYHYQWYSASTAACPSGGATLGTSSMQSVAPTVSTYYCYTVTDSSVGTPFVSGTSSADFVVVNGALSAGAITPSNPIVDAGQSVTLTASASGGTAPYTYQWYSGTSLTCTSDTNALGTGPVQSVSPSSLTYYCYHVSDASIGGPAPGTSSITDPVNVNPNLVAGSIAPSSPTIDNGQSITLTSAATGGTPSYSYQWFAGGSCTTPITGAISSTFATSPFAATVYSYKVTDSASTPLARCSPDDIVTVNPSLTAGAVVPSTPTIDLGQSVTLSASPSGGTAPYMYQWYSGMSVTCSLDTTLLGTSVSQTVSPTAATYYCYSVTDSAFTRAIQSSATNLVTVAPALAAGPITPASPTVDTGQSLTLTANPSGGATPYSIQWYSGTSATCSSDTTTLGTGTAQIVSPTTPTYYCYRVTDSSKGNPAASIFSATDLVAANPALSIQSVSTTSPIDSGQTTTITLTWSGGTSPYSATLYTSTSSTSCTGLIQIGQNPAISSLTTSFSESPTAATNYCASVSDSATSPVTLQASPRVVIVNPAFIINTPSASPSTIDSGQSSQLSAVFSGGTAPYTCQWLEEAPSITSFTDLGGAVSCTSPASATTGVLTTLGTWSFELQVTDSASVSQVLTSATTSLTVNPSLTAPSIAASPTPIDAGQSSTLSTTTSFSGGASPYTCQWLKKGPLDSGYNLLATSFVCSPSDKPTASTGSLSVAGIWSFKLQVTDSNAPPQLVSSAPVSVTVNGALSAGAISPGAPTIDAGQSITLSANPFGGVSPYTYQWYSDSSCATQVVSATAATFTASPLLSSTYTYRVTDSASSSQCSPADSVTVSPSLISPVITPSSATLDVGQSLTLTASPSGGTAPYSLQWYSAANCPVGNLVTGASSSSYLASPTSTTTYSVQIMDASQGIPNTAQCSSGATVTVNAALAAGPVTPSAPTIDAGQPITLTSHSSGGTPSVAIQWFTGQGCATSIAGATSTTYTTSPSSTTTISYRATDSATTPESSCSPADTVTVNSALSSGAVTPTNPSIDNGQSITLTANPSAGTTPYSYQWYSGTSATCASDIQTVGTSPTITVSPSTNTYYCYTVTDLTLSSQSSSTDLVSVNPGLLAGTITPSSPTIDSGQSITLTSNPTGGTTPYRYQWYSTPNPSCPAGSTIGTTATLTVTPTIVTSYCYVVTDSSQGTPAPSATSAATSVTVSPVLQAAAISPSSPTIDFGQPVTLTANPSGGLSPYKFQWYSGTSPSCSSDTTPLGTGPSQTVSPAASTYYCYVVSDNSAGSPMAKATSTADLVTVSGSALSAAPISPSSPIIDDGQSITLTGIGSGGTSPYSYQWYSGGTCNSPITGANSQSYLASPSLTATYSYKVSDSASSPASVCSTANTITVNSILVAGAITPTSPTLDYGQSIILTAHPSGGTIPYSYQWYSGTNPSCASDTTGLGTGSTQPISPIASAYYCYKLTDVSQGSPLASSTSSTVLVTVNPTLSAGQFTPLSPTIDSGQTIILTANPTGGTSPYSYQWFADGACITLITGATGPTYSASPASTIAYSVSVTDSAASSQCSPSETVTVNPTLSAGAITPSVPSIDSGQTIILNSLASGGTLPISIQWFSDGACTTTITAATGSTFAASPVTTTTYSYRIIDGSQGTPTGSRCSASDTVSVSPMLVAGSITPSNPTIDNGQSIALAAAKTGGTSPYFYQWFTGGPCANAISGATSSSYVPTPSSTTTYSYSVTDSAVTPVSRCSPSDTITVNPTLIPGAITPSTPTIDGGQSIMLAANPSGGTTQYFNQWYLDGTCSTSISGATGSTYSASPSATSTYSYKVTDSSFSPASQCSIADIVTVNPVLVAGSISPPVASMDSGQSIVLTANPSGGTASYSYQWFSGPTSTCSLDTTPLGTMRTQSVSPIANTYYCYKVTDSSSGTPIVSVTSSTNFVTVNAILVAGAINPASPTIDLGQSVTLTAAASGGTAPYTYQWYSGTSPSCSSDTSTVGTGPILKVSPSISTYYCYTVTDSASGLPTKIAISPTDLVILNSPLAVSSPTVAQPILDSGQSTSLSASFSGGTPSYTCQWLQYIPSAGSYSDLGVASPCGTPNSIPTGTLLAVGTWSFKLQVKDGPGSILNSTAITVVVNPDLGPPTIAVSSPTVSPGQSATLSTTSSFTGGTQTYSCQWQGQSPLSSSYTEIGSSFACGPATKPTISTGTLSTSGSWSFRLQVTDSGSPPLTTVSQLISLTVQKDNPSIALTLSSAHLTVGGSATGSATISQGFQVSGNVTFHIFTATACTGASTVTLHSVPAGSTTVASSPQVFNSAGTFAWDTVYSGDSNNVGAVSSCQLLTVVSTLSTPTSITVGTGSTVRFVVNSTDPNTSQTITLTSSNLPDGASFASSQSSGQGIVSSIFTWTPSSDQAGNYTVTFTATAGGVAATSQVTIHVNAVARAAPLPILTYSIFGVVGFVIVITAAILLRRFQNPRRNSK